MNEQKVFLARGEEVFGPYTLEKIREMEASGELSEFTWMFDGSSPHWIPVSPPPPIPTQLPYEMASEQPIPGAGLKQTPAESQEISQNPGPAAAPAAAAEQIELGIGLLAVCHDFRNVMSGKLDRAWPKGCVFVSPSVHSALSPFRKGARVWLNLLHESTGSAENIHVSVDGCRKRGDAEWEIALGWDQLPLILKR